MADGEGSTTGWAAFGIKLLDVLGRRWGPVVVIVGGLLFALISTTNSIKLA